MYLNLPTRNHTLLSFFFFFFFWNDLMIMLRPFLSACEHNVSNILAHQGDMLRKRKVTGYIEEYNWHYDTAMFSWYTMTMNTLIIYYTYDVTKDWISFWWRYRLCQLWVIDITVLTSILLLITHFCLLYFHFSSSMVKLCLLKSWRTSNIIYIKIYVVKRVRGPGLAHLHIWSCNVTCEPQHCVCKLFVRG